MVAVDQTGKVSVALDTAALDASSCGDNGVGGFGYHIHELWEHADMHNRFGPSDCGADNTGGHYNPYDTPVCSAVGDRDYWSCELGDLSGRFGHLVPVDGKVFAEGTVAASCADCGARLNPESVAGKSIVFHCLSGERLFCAPFNMIVSA